MVLCQLVEGTDGDAGAVRPQALVVLAVTFGLVVAWVEAAETVEVVPAILSVFFREGKAQFDPDTVIGCDVDAGGFNPLRDLLDIIRGGDAGLLRLSLTWCWLGFLLKPLVVEIIAGH